MDNYLCKHQDNLPASQLESKPLERLLSSKLKRDRNIPVGLDGHVFPENFSSIKRIALAIPFSDLICLPS
jgi:hypothetical protein